MYTQCPNCDIAFKVTAEVLKQAAGKVRCGGCGSAFNALEFLSEQMPERRPAKAADTALPELTPEFSATAGGPPRTISAEQSAALLKTLDELAGSDIRIEDTGVEWRVLDDEDAVQPAAENDDAGPGAPVETVDEFLDDNATPIDEFLTATPDVIDSPEIFEEPDSAASRISVDELRFDDDTPLPEDFDLGDTSSFRPGVEPEYAEPELAEPDESYAAAEAADNRILADAPPVGTVQDIALSEPDEWTDILGEFQDLIAEVDTPVDVTQENAAADEDLPADDDAADEHDSDQLLDVDTQFARQAEAMGIDLSGLHAIEDELQAAEADVDELERALDASDLEYEDDESADEVVTESELDVEAADDDLDRLDLADDPEVDGFDVDEPQELIDEPIIESHSIERELDASDDAHEHYVPPMTEEEQTVNLQIDQDLMALAIEDGDGFASTIVIAEKQIEKSAGDGESDDDGPDDEPDKAFATETGFETIIMEGDRIRTALDEDRSSSSAETAKEIQQLLERNRAAKAVESGGRRWGLIAGAAGLLLLLLVQMLHQSREALATVPAFSSAIGAVYRALGQPVQPAWDITGWRFEVTNDRTEKTESGEEHLTVFSRIGNRSDSPLPYPLINISLRDRFEETIGSSILEPADYLPDDLDPREHVQPGNSFNAVISITALSAEATGYKLNVCYRQKESQLRCNFEDFK